ncbi:ECF transporter S component [Lentilactobacillus raoultii]|uniref:ECF transporter S component n=1 Tax=Lentilactobacillus raoultii TaxID=1987503 RepID=A0ABW3PPG7_9LACO|nr:ECF transporter S component [Lentilactobacillus raoultii]
MRQFTLKNIILLTLISLFFGVIYWSLGPIYTALTAFLTPFGLGPAANDVLEGIWVMAGPLAGFVFKLPGAATLTETLSAVVEMFIGGQFGAAAILAGLLQGFGAELGFLLTGYKFWNWFSLALSVFFVTIMTFARELIFYGYAKYALSYLLLLFIIRLISTFIFSGILNMMILKMLYKTQVLNETRK